MDSDDMDMSFVAPHRRAETRRRILLLRAYLQAPGIEAAKGTAKELGLSLSSFYNLARAWEQGKAELLPGSGRSRKRKDQLTDEQRQILKDVTEKQPAEVLQRAIENALELGKARDVEMPSWNTIRVHLRKMMVGSLPAGSFAADSDFAVDHVAVDIPVQHGAVAIMPIAAVVLRVEDATILSVNLTMDGPSPESAGAATMAALGRMLGGGTSFSGVLAIESFPGPSWKIFMNDLARLPLNVRVFERHSIGRKGPAAALLPERLGGIRIKPRLVTKGRGERLVTLPAGASALSLDQANALIRERWLWGL